jgi:uncharacterized protein YjbI with pentapeptide repeats
MKRGPDLDIEAIFDDLESDRGSAPVVSPPLDDPISGTLDDDLDDVDLDDTDLDDTGLDVADLDDTDLSDADSGEATDVDPDDAH